jgi:tetratricopeptide (TPR) repeat protein
MTGSQEPFFNSKVECPVCGTVNEYVNIRSGAYTESGRDTDFNPTGRVWQDPAYQKYDPLLFFMATCKKCHYTREFNRDFKNWDKDTSFKTYRRNKIKEKHQVEFSNNDGIIRLLGSHIHHERYPFESAVIKLALGIYDELLIERPSALNLGRYFLRIAWLFRGKSEDFDNQTNGTIGFFAKLRGAAAEAGSVLPNYGDKVEELRNLINRDFSLMFKDLPRAADYRKQIEQAIDEISESVRPLTEANSKLTDIFDDAEKVLLGRQPDRNEAFFKYSSFQEFLAGAKHLWNDIPLSEKEALIKACEYYQKAYQTGGEISQGIQQIQAAYLIAELSRRIGEFKNASQYFDQMIKMGRDLVTSKSGDSGTINYTKNLLELAMSQARLNKKQHGDLAR